MHGSKEESLMEEAHLEDKDKDKDGMIILKIDLTRSRRYVDLNQ
jgi:hypothetical protein